MGSCLGCDYWSVQFVKGAEWWISWSCVWRLQGNSASELQKMFWCLLCPFCFLSCVYVRLWLSPCILCCSNLNRFYFLCLFKFRPLRFSEPGIVYCKLPTDCPQFWTYMFYVLDWTELPWFLTKFWGWI